jgi:hypothetical protein
VTDARLLSRARRLLEPVTCALDALIAAAAPYDGLFPSILDRTSGAMLRVLPPAIPGQRDGDRAHLGSNLIHDEAALRTLLALAEPLARPEYAAGADAYLARFSALCTETPTGLFPWGEHAYWHLVERRVGNSYALAGRPTTPPTTHDHLRQAPLWLWERLWALNPRAVERFSEGLDLHWIADDRHEYIRHAYIEEPRRHTPGARSCDFPRHGGFYIIDWAYAWLKTRRDAFRDQIRTMLDYWWPKRDGRGLLLIESRSPEDDPAFYGINSPAQTLSLATSLYEAADMIEERDPALAGVMRERAAVYTGGFYAAPHDLAAGVFVYSSRREDNAAVRTMPVWGSVYGLWPASYVALTCLCAYRLTADPRHLAWAEAVGRAYRAAEFPGDVAVPAMDAGLAVGLLADLYDITGEEDWLAGAVALGERVAAIYLDAPLPRGAAGVDWYESQMGPSSVLHGLARTALLAEDRAGCPLDADYTAR